MGGERGADDRVMMVVAALWSVMLPLVKLRLLVVLSVAPPFTIVLLWVGVMVAWGVCVANIMRGHGASVGDGGVMMM